MIKLLSTPSCSQCKIAKMMLEKKAIDYQVIDAGSPEGTVIIEKYNVMKLPFIIDGDKIYVTINEYLVQPTQDEPVCESCHA